MVVGQGFGRGENEASGFDSFGSDQSVGEFSDEPRGAAQEDDFEATAGVEVDVGGGDDRGEVVVLQVGETFGDAAGVVVVHQGDDPHGFGVVVGDDFLDQGGSHQSSNRLAAVGILVRLAVAVELLEKFAADRDAESNQRVLFHGKLGRGFEEKARCAKADWSGRFSTGREAGIRSLKDR